MSDFDTPDPDEPEDVVEGESDPDAAPPDEEPDTTRTLDSI
jgi:hypothetical protein